MFSIVHHLLLFNVAGRLVLYHSTAFLMFYFMSCGRIECTFSRRLSEVFGILSCLRLHPAFHIQWLSLLINLTTSAFSNVLQVFFHAMRLMCVSSFVQSCWGPLCLLAIAFLILPNFLVCSLLVWSYLISSIALCWYSPILINYWRLSPSISFVSSFWLFCNVQKKQRCWRWRTDRWHG